MTKNQKERNGARGQGESGANRPAEPLSLRAYARRRGVSPEAVSRAIESGRLRASVTRHTGVPKIADPELADREWAANTDLSRAPDSVKAKAAAAPAASHLEPQPHGGALKRNEALDPDEDAEDDEPTLADWSKEEKQWRAKTAELKYRERAGELVDAASVKAGFIDRITTARTRLLGIPSKAKQQLPHLTIADLEAIDGIVREALEALADQAAAEGAAA